MINLRFTVSGDTRREQLLKGKEVDSTASIPVDFAELDKSERELLLKHSVLTDNNNLIVGYDQSKDKPEIIQYNGEIQEYSDSVYKVGPSSLATIDAYDYDSLIKALKDYEQYKKDLVKKSEQRKEELKKINQEKFDENRKEFINAIRNRDVSLVRKTYDHGMPVYTILGSFRQKVEKYEVDKELVNDFENFIEEKNQPYYEVRDEHIRKDNQIEKERKKWIQEHGSTRLKKMLELGYELKMSYEQERTNQEYPGFQVDSNNDRFTWIDRANPSDDALRMLDKYLPKTNKDVTDSEIVYVEDDYNEPDDIEGYEAIRMIVSWCRFNLIGSIDVVTVVT